MREQQIRSAARFALVVVMTPLLYVSLLSGCSSPALTRYAPDAGSAKLRYVTTASVADSTYLSHADRSTCPAAPTWRRLADTGGMLAAPKEKTALSMIGASEREEALIREFYIPAEQPFVFYVRAIRGTTLDCDSAGVFLPRAGRQYELRHVVEPKTFACIVQIEELSQDPGAQVARQRERTAHFFYPPEKSTDYCNVETKGEGA